MAKNTPGVSVYLDSKKTVAVLSKLKTIGTEAPSTTQSALLAGSQTVVNSAKAKVRKKTGTLSRSIHAEVNGPEEVVVGTDVTYAKYQEFGTSKMQGHPYLRPALSENTEKVVAKVQRAYKSLLASQDGS